MIGFDLYTHHTNPAGLCSDTAGMYFIKGQWAAGVLKNSECKVGAWGAWAPQSNVLTVGRVGLKVGALIGVIGGYQSRPLVPMVVPSVAAGGNRHWVRVSYLPRSPGALSDGWHVSLERGF